MKNDTQNSNTLKATANPWLFDTHNVRTAVDERGEAWFCAKDVFDALDIAWKGTGTSLKNYPEEWICTLYLRGQSGTGDVIFISEPAVYRVAFRSDKPLAIAFANWVCADVLPAIRRHGHFGVPSHKERLGLSRQISMLAERMASNKDAMVHQLLASELRDLSNLLGLPMPDFSLLGKDRSQLALPL